MVTPSWDRALPTSATARLAASTARPRRWTSSLADLLVALMPLGILLIGYAAAYAVNLPLTRDPVAGSTNALGFALRATEPADLDRWVFGALPSSWFQDRWVREPGGAWWDGVTAVVYASHFVVIPVVTAALWFVDRRRFRQWVWSVIALVGAGVTLYVVYPMSPPWLAAQQGLIEPVVRWSGIGWQVMGLDAIGSLQGSGQAGSNPVAAMPSLHAGAATLVAAFFLRGGRWWRAPLLVLYALAMSVALVYTGEHYVIDVVVGAALAVAAALFVGVAFRLRRDRTSAAGTGPDARPDPGTGTGTGTGRCVVDAETA